MLQQLLLHSVFKRTEQKEQGKAGWETGVGGGREEEEECAGVAQRLEPCRNIWESKAQTLTGPRSWWVC